MTHTIGFDGSSGTKRAGRADSTAVVLLPVEAPTTPRVVGYWEDTGDDGWEPPRPEVCALVERLLSDPACVGMGADPSYWADEVAAWTAAHAERMRTRRFALSTKERAWSFELLRDAITQQVIQFDRSASDYPLFREHVMSMRLDDLGRIDKAHGGPAAGRIDVGAALSYAAVARIRCIEAGPRSSMPPPKWPGRVLGINRFRPVDTVAAVTRCVLPECSEWTSAYFHSEDCLAHYKARWPDDSQLERRGKLVGAAVERPPDRVVAAYGRQTCREVWQVDDGNGGTFVEDRNKPRPSRFL